MQDTVENQHKAEVNSGDRFTFGENWAQFLKLLNDERIALAEQSLRDMLGVQSLEGRTFLDIGSGSGLFSLAARRLGAKVHSFDYDSQSFACTRTLRERFFADDPNWKVEQGSVLDPEYMASLGTFDVVYSWGVLHHTGNMHLAMDHAAARVRDGGRLFIAIYNDQGRASKWWLTIKQAYNRLPSPLRGLVLYPCFVRLWGPTILRDTLRGNPLHSWNAYARDGLRGMNPWRDVVDWVGGLPFEVDKPEGTFSFHQARGFSLHRMRTCAGGHGCNEFVFVRSLPKIY